MYIEIHVLVHKGLRELGGGRDPRSSEAVWKADRKGNVQLEAKDRAEFPMCRRGELLAMACWDHS